MNVDVTYPESMVNPVLVFETMVHAVVSSVAEGFVNVLILTPI